MTRSEIVAFLEEEASKADRWSRPDSGVLRFMLTGPELNRIKVALRDAAAVDRVLPAVTERLIRHVGCGSLDDQGQCLMCDAIRSILAREPRREEERGK